MQACKLHEGGQGTVVCLQAGRDSVLCGGSSGCKLLLGPGNHQDTVYTLHRVSECQERCPLDTHAWCAQPQSSPDTAVDLFALLCWKSPPTLHLAL